MKKFKILVLSTIFLLSLSGCTENDRARNYGGTMTVKLKPNQKLVNVTWKQNELWYLTKEMSQSDVAETYKFQEDSRWGMVQGTVILIEQKGKNDELVASTGWETMLEGLIKADFIVTGKQIGRAHV